MKQPSDNLPGRETSFPAEKPTEPNRHIPEQRPERSKEAPTEPNPQIPEWEPEKTTTPDPYAPKYGLRISGKEQQVF
jgi:hypothetical protein